MKWLNLLRQSEHTLKQFFKDDSFFDVEHEIRALASFVLKRDVRTLDLDAPISAEKQQALEQLIQQRGAERTPLQYLLGHTWFHNLPKPLFISQDTLIPRSDSETVLFVIFVIQKLVEAALKHASQATKILDMGTGCGALLLACMTIFCAFTWLVLYALPNARGLGIDISPGALQMAHKNAQVQQLTHAASFAQADMLVPQLQLGMEQFDLIVSNPPYVCTQEIAQLDPEVRNHEPHVALDGGADGMQFYKAIQRHCTSSNLLRSGGVLVLVCYQRVSHFCRNLASKEPNKSNKS